MRAAGAPRRTRPRSGRGAPGRSPAARLVPAGTEPRPHGPLELDSAPAARRTRWLPRGVWLARRGRPRRLAGARRAPRGRALALAALLPPLLVRCCSPPRLAPGLRLARRARWRRRSAASGSPGRSRRSPGRPRAGAMRAALGALGYWWLRSPSPLLGARRCGSARPPARRRARSGRARSASPRRTSSRRCWHVGVLLGALLWAVAAVVLPWLVRGRSAAARRRRRRGVVGCDRRSRRPRWTRACALSAAHPSRAARCSAPCSARSRGCRARAARPGLTAALRSMAPGRRPIAEIDASAACAHQSRR